MATDILSRGIDIDSIGLVINFDVPGDAEDYVHRVGRTARAESNGVALTLINPGDQQKFKRIEDLIGYEVKNYPCPPIWAKRPLTTLPNIKAIKDSAGAAVVKVPVKAKAVEVDTDGPDIFNTIIPSHPKDGEGCPAKRAQGEEASC